MIANAALGNSGKRSISYDGMDGKAKNSEPNSNADSRNLRNGCPMDERYHLLGATQPDARNVVVS